MTTSRRPSPHEPASLFCAIVSQLSDGALRPTPDTIIHDLFAAPESFSALDYELALYSVEATLRRELADSFYEGDIEHTFQLTIAEFFATQLSDDVSDDPLFVSRILERFASAARLTLENEAAGGEN